MNFDAWSHVLERCEVSDLMFGIGKACQDFQWFSQRILAKKTCLVIREGDLTENFLFYNRDGLNEISVVFEEQRSHDLCVEQKLNVCSTLAADLVRSLFTNLEELVISGSQFQNPENLHRLLKLFPWIKSLKCFNISMDLAPFLAHLPQLRHFVHLDSKYSYAHYAENGKEVLARLDSFGFRHMDDGFDPRSFDSKKFVQFEYLHYDFYMLPDFIRERLAEKIDCFSHQFNYIDADDIKYARYEEFVNLTKLSLSFCINEEKDNALALMRILKMLSKLDRLETLHLVTPSYSNERLLDCLSAEENVPVFRNVKFLHVDCSVNDSNKVVIKRLFPSAKIFYQRNQ